MVRGYKNTEVKPEDIIPGVSGAASKFTLKMCIEMDFDWARDFAGTSFKDYNSWHDVFNDTAYSTVKETFAKAIFHTVYRYTVYRSVEAGHMQIDRGTLVSCNVSNEIEKIFQDYRKRHAKEKAATDKLKAAELKKQAKELLLKAKQLEAK